jgi:hypothetical protein
MTTANTRLYVVGPKIKAEGDKEARRLVRAANNVQALRHVAEDTLFCTIASQDDVFALAAAGKKIEDAKAPQGEPALL